MEIVLKKILITTILIFITITIFTIPTINNNKVIRTNLAIEDVTNINTNKVYLLNDKNVFVQVDIFIDDKEDINSVKSIIKYLTKGNDDVPKGLKTYIPKNTKLLDCKIDNNILYLDFSKDLLNGDINCIITGLVYSLIEIDSFNNIKITINNKAIPNYDKLLNKNIGINNSYLFNTRKDLNRVVIYYLYEIDENKYYVPITKYLNDKREKIEIVVDELSKASLNRDLISTMSSKTSLLDYKEDNNMLLLNFNNSFMENSSNSELLQEIAYSSFDNYDINMVIFEVDGKKIDSIKR